MAEYNVNYHFDNCTDNGSSATYSTDAKTYWKVLAKAVDGCTFKEKDTANCYFYRTKSGSKTTTTISLTKVASTKDSQVISGDIDGITSDGKYFSYSMLFGSTNTSEMECYIKASVGTPITTLTITNNVSNTTASYEVDGSNYIVKIGGGETGMFENPPVLTYKNSYGEVQQTEMTLSDSHNAYLAIPTGTNTSVTITGEYVDVIPTLNITNNVENTTYGYTISGEYFVITLQGNTTGEYTTAPTCKYIDGTTTITKQFDVVGNTATCKIPTTITRCEINGTFEPEKESVPITNTLTKCEIVPVYDSITIGDILSVKITAITGYELKQIYLIWSDGTNEYNVAGDITTGEISFQVPENCSYINITGYAELITPVGANYGCINVYKVSNEQLDSFSTKRFFTEDTQSESGITYIDLGVYVNRIKRLFINVPVSGTGSIKCGNYNTGVIADLPENDTTILDFGYLTLTGQNANGHDYNATLQVFLPFIGLVSLDSAFIDKTIHLTYTINIITGDGACIISYLDTPIFMANVSVCRDVIYKTSNYTLQTIGGDNFEDNSLYGFEPYVIMNYTETAPLDINNTKEQITIQDITGYAKFDGVQVNFACLADEQNKIENLLQQGVIL